MASVIKQTFSDILNRLYSIPLSGLGPFSDEFSIQFGLGEGMFKQVSMYNQQHERMKDASGYSVATPAVFIEWLPQQVTQIGQKVTQSDVLIKVHILHEELTADDGMMDQNISVFDTRDTVKRYLNGFKPSSCGALQQSGEEQDYSHDNVYHYLLQFSTVFIDTAGSKIITGPFSDDGNYKENTPPATLELQITSN